MGGFLANSRETLPRRGHAPGGAPARDALKTTSVRVHGDRGVDSADCGGRSSSSFTARTCEGRDHMHCSGWAGLGLQNPSAGFDSLAVCRLRIASPIVISSHCSDLRRGRTAHNRAEESSTLSAATSRGDPSGLPRPATGRTWMVTGPNWFDSNHPDHAGCGRLCRRRLTAGHFRLSSFARHRAVAGWFLVRVQVMLVRLQPPVRLILCGCSSTVERFRLASLARLRVGRSWMVIDYQSTGCRFESGHLHDVFRGVVQQRERVAWAHEVAGASPAPLTMRDHALHADVAQR